MTNPVRFTKMHGAGNDYIYVNTMAYPLENPEKQAVTEQARGEAYRLQAFRHPIPVERHLHAQRLTLLPHGDKEPEQRAFRCGLHHLENRGQEGGETYRRAGADHSAAPCAELRHSRAGQKK